MVANRPTIKFVVQAASLNKRGKILKDKDGYYTMPFFVFDKPSTNGKLYETNHMIDCLTNPGHRFYRTLMGRKLYGEHGHPITSDFDRLTKIKEKNIAKFIEAVWSDTLADGSMVGMYKFKPFGPYGKYYEQALEDPDTNGSCSIRIIAAEGPKERDYQILYPKAMITIDGVGAGGYPECCVEHAKAVDGVHRESMGYDGYYETDLAVNDICNPSKGGLLVSTESMTSDALKEYFMSDHVTVTRRVLARTEVPVHAKLESFYRHFILRKGA